LHCNSQRDVNDAGTGELCAQPRHWLVNQRNEAEHDHHHQSDKASTRHAAISRVDGDVPDMKRYGYEEQARESCTRAGRSEEEVVPLVKLV
jgi:hypothetical protein